MNDPKGEVNLRTFVIAAAAAIPAAIAGAPLARLLDLSIHEVEEVAASALLVYGSALVLRWLIHLRLKYLHFDGRPGERWQAAKRRRLMVLTVADGVLVLVLTAAAVEFLVRPGHLFQWIFTTAMLVAIWFEIEATRATIEDGGPPCGADVIEHCKPVRALLDPKKLWNGKWGIDSFWEFVTEKIPVGHRSKVAVVLIFGLAFSSVTEAGAVIARRFSESSQQTPAPIVRNPSPKSHVDPKPEPPEATVPEPSGPRSYDENCGTEVTPGDGVPEPLRAAIKQAWEESGPADGCAQRAHRDRSGRAYLVPGECQGRRWSLGIASWEYGAAILLENAAEAAEEVAAEAEIDGASARADVADGDFQLIYTPVGPYLLIRPQKTDGHGGVEHAPYSCSEIVRGKETYEVLTPAMADLFLRYNRQVQHAWPAAVDRDTGGSFDLVSADGSGKVLAHALCPSTTECRLKGDLELTAVPADLDEVTVPAIQEYGPR